MSDSNSGGLKRGLKVRHVNMIAIGGAIGTGLFLATGGSLGEAGPGGALVAYALIGVMVFFLMTSLGEMSTHMPITGSFETYASRFVDPAFGFALGWNYWYNWAITVAAELEAAVIVFRYWAPDVHPMLISGVCLALLFLLNFVSVKGYGESEFWFAGIKVVTIIIFLVVGVLMIFGIMGSGSPGFENWTLSDANTGNSAPFPTGALGLLGIFMIAGFSFQGTELIGVAAGEAEDPQKTIPKAIRTVFLRIMLFYIGAIVVIGFLLPFNDPSLLGASESNISASPFTLIFERAGIAGVAAIMNAVILTSVLSCANSGMYASTRMLYSLAMEGKAPKIFKKVNKRGVPVPALLLTTAVGLAAFLGYLASPDTVYLWLVGASGLAGFIAWFGVALSHYRFRKAFLAQGHKLSELKFKSYLFPFGPIFAIILVLVVIVGQFYSDGVLNNDNMGEVVKGFMVTYAGAVLFFVLFFWYKIKHKTKMVKYEEADLSQAFSMEEASEKVDK